MAKRPTKQSLTRVLAKVRRAIEEGEVEIANDAFHKGQHAVTVRSTPNGLEFAWSREGIGFGVLTLTAVNGRLAADVEGMSDQFCLDVLRQALAERSK